ncbi:MAG: D-alanyl-D-alanine carboxypeptidase [Clostridia bacterium]|nr:D-alanyl-D-alanine carboxypeptidase [Clostridia bacterium]
MTQARCRALSETRRHCRRAFLLFLTVAVLLPSLLLALPLPAEAETEAPPPNGEVGSVLLINLENNLTLFEKNPDTAIYPSSSVKIMTGLLSCRALSDRLDEEVTVTAAMLSGAEGRRMNPPLADGEVLTVRDLLYAAVCGGYNDASLVVACLASGSVAAFVEDMNREAQRLGTVHTRYTNPTGLHDPAMATSARDVSLIAREAYGNALVMQISSARTYTIPATNTADSRSFTNRNALISDSSQNYYNGYCQGMNAGMTDEGGWCVVTVCERGGAANLCIVMRGQDVATGELIPAYVYTNRLLAWANRAYAYRTVLTPDDVLDTLKVSMTGVSKSKADIVPVSDLKVYLPADADTASALTYTTTLRDGGLTAPLTAGQVVGTVTVTYEGRVVGKTDLTVTEDFTRNGFLSGLMGFRSYLTSRPFLITVVLFVILLLIYLRITTGPGGRYGIRSVRRRRVNYVKRKY